MKTREVEEAQFHSSRTLTCPTDTTVLFSLLSSTRCNEANHKKMAPAKARPRQRQAQVAPAHHQRSYTSDLDSDTYINPSATSVAQQQPPTNPLKRTNSQLNLTVLRRHNPDIIRILSIAPFAAVYVFSTATQEWEKSGVEGTLFVVQLAPGSNTEAESENYTNPQQERFAVIVLNRRGLENFQIELRREDDVEITEDYIIVQGDTSDSGARAGQTMAEADGTGAGSNIYGFWIFTELPPSSTTETRRIIAGLIQECAALAESSRKLCNSTSGVDRSGWDATPGGNQQAMSHSTPDVVLDQLDANAMATDGQGITTNVLGDLFRRAKENYESTN